MILVLKLKEFAKLELLFVMLKTLLQLAQNLSQPQQLQDVLMMLPRFVIELEPPQHSVTIQVLKLKEFAKLAIQYVMPRILPHNVKKLSLKSRQ